MASVLFRLWRQRGYPETLKGPRLLADLKSRDRAGVGGETSAMRSEPPPCPAGDSESPDAPSTQERTTPHPGGPPRRRDQPRAPHGLTKTRPGEGPRPQCAAYVSRLDAAAPAGGSERGLQGQKPVSAASLPAPRAVRFPPPGGPAQARFPDGPELRAPTALTSPAVLGR